MRSHDLEVIRRGAEAALLASVPQVVLPKIEARLLLGAGRNPEDLGPNLMQALAHRIDSRLQEDTRWMTGSAFHFAYSAAWGAVYALAYERRPVNPWLGGLALAGVIYGLTFPPWGGAVLIGAVDPPKKRSLRVEIVLASAPLIFGLGTALLYGRGPNQTWREKLRGAWRKGKRRGIPRV